MGSYWFAVFSLKRLAVVLPSVAILLQMSLHVRRIYSCRRGGVPSLRSKEGCEGLTVVGVCSERAVVCTQ